MASLLPTQQPRSQLLLLLLLLLVAASLAATPCTNPNDCQAAPGTPYCLNGVCVQCNPNYVLKTCDCPIAEYCVGDPLDPSYGSCRAYETAILGRQCNTNLKDEGLTTTFGFDDTMFCGLVKYNTTDNKARYVEWEGTCQKGRCYVCSTAPIPTAPVSYCSDGRVCVGNEFNYAVVGIFSWSFFFVNPLVMSFYIAIACLVVAIFIVLYGVSAYTYYQRKYFRHLNGESDEPDNANDDTDINSGSGSYFINPSSASSRRNGNVY